MPGQFVMVRLVGTLDPLLRRPMSVADSNEDGSMIGLLIQITGRGTRLLSNLRIGDHVDILGPLGNHFSFPDGAKNVWIVAGGCGLAPFLGLVQNKPDRLMEYTLFLGARSADLVLYEDQLTSAGATVIVSTEDGSRGHKGVVTSFLKLRSG